MSIDLRTSAARHDEVLRRRLDLVLPLAMEAGDLDVWIVAGREYAEGAVLRSMLPATWLSARRRTVLVLRRDSATGAVERLAVGRYDIEDLYPSAWDPQAQPDQWSRVAEIVAEGDPRRIGLDTSAVLAHADGLSASERDALVAALPDDLTARLVSAQTAAVAWLETRLPEEIETLRVACAQGHALLARALSSEAITPGRTTTDDVVWWLRQQVHDGGLPSWFHPTVEVVRPARAHDDQPERREGFSARLPETVIQSGDLVHIDFGLTLHGLCTDQQQHGYVLRPGETQAPVALVEGMAVGNRLQDLVLEQFEVGRTGDEVLRGALAAARAEGIDAIIYSHPIGLQGHGAGPSIGLWDSQDGVVGSGALPVRPDTCWSIELSAWVTAPGWPEDRVRIRLEEDAVFDGVSLRWLDGRQTELHLIGASPTTSPPA